MKQLLLLTMIISLVVTGCRDDDDGSRSSNTTPETRSYTNTLLSGSSVNASFKGRITDQDGNAVANAYVQIGPSFTNTNEYGFYKITNVPVDAAFASIKVLAANYFDQFRNLKPRTSHDNVVDIQMIPKVYSHFFEAAQGGTLQVENGGSVVFEPNSLVDEEGNPYTGQVFAATTYLDPTDIALPNYMPGSNAAVDLNDNGVVMITYGMIGVDMLGSNGQSLQVGPDYTAQISFPIADAQMAHAPESIALWYFEEGTGVWYEEGSATKTGNSYTADVTHFSFWNCDIGIPLIYLEGTIDFEGTGATYANIKFERPDGSAAYSSTDGNGYFSGMVPANEELIMTAYTYSCGSEVVLVSSSVGPYSADTDLGMIAIADIPAITSTVFSGTVVDCDGAPVEGIAVLYDGPGVFPAYALTGPDGLFEFSIPCLNTGALNYELVDLDNLLQGISGEVPYDVSTSEVYDLDELSFCETTEIDNFLTYIEGGNEFLYSFVQVADSSMCSLLNAWVDPVNFQEGQVYLYFETTETPGFINLCAEETYISYSLDDGSFYNAYLEMSGITVTDVAYSDGAYTLIEGTYTGTVYVNISNANNPVTSYTSAASGAFHFEQ